MHALKILGTGLIAATMMSSVAGAADLAARKTVFAAPAIQAPEWMGSVLFHGSYLGVTNGFSDRTSFGSQIDAFHRSGWGVHVEGSGHFREEDAGYFSGGLSYAFTPSVRAKLQLGTSTNNRGILPSFAAIGSVEIKSDPALGLVVTPSVAYRKFRNGVEEVAPKIDLSKYFAPFANGAYVVGQIGASVISVNPGSNVGYELSAGATYVMPNSYSAGVEVFGGEMAYDVLLNNVSAGNVKNRFIGVRPKVGFNITNSVELFVRGEFVNTRYYDSRGGTLGLVARF